MLPLHHTFFSRFKYWVHLHHFATFLLCAAGVVAATGIAVAAVSYQSPQADRSHVTYVPSASSTPTPTPTPPPVFYSPLTGEKVPDQASTQAAVTGVMIENSLESRPQSGLKAAGVVFEAIAEGGITRFLALYQSSKPQVIGPVRSLRLYDIDWFAPFQASIAHVGGSQQALKEVRNGTYRDIDQFVNSGYYQRVTDRYAPHNVYTSFAKLDALNAKKGYTTSVFTPWPRQDGSAAKTPTATDVNVHISGALYDSRYTFDPATDTYLRAQAGKPHLDREAGQIAPSVVIVIDVVETKVMQDGWREQITTTGSGKAHIFQNGTETEATWTKADRGSQMAFTDSSGKPVAFNRGQTWITAVPANQGGKVTWTKK
jgi:hypothetical protein